MSRRPKRNFVTTPLQYWKSERVEYEPGALPGSMFYLIWQTNVFRSYEDCSHENSSKKAQKTLIFTKELVITSRHDR